MILLPFFKSPFCQYLGSIPCLEVISNTILVLVGIVSYQVTQITTDLFWEVLDATSQGLTVFMLPLLTMWSYIFTMPFI